jgi:hypothetical protein
VGNLDKKSGSDFELFFMMTYMDNLYTNIEGYFELSFVMSQLGKLNAKLGVTYKL